MRFLYLLSVLSLSACSSSPSPRTSSVAPAPKASSEQLTPEAMSELVVEQKGTGTSQQTSGTNSLQVDELRSEVAKSYAGLRTREGRSLTQTQQGQATEHTLSLVAASQQRDYIAMSSSAQSLMGVLQTVSPQKLALVDGLALAKAIQDVVAASLQANVQEILKAVTAIVAAAMG